MVTGYYLHCIISLIGLPYKNKSNVFFSYYIGRNCTFIANEQAHKSATIPLKTYNIRNRSFVFISLKALGLQDPPNNLHINIKCRITNGTSASLRIFFQHSLWLE